MKNFKLRPIPLDFADRFPDGDYTIGRGADPRGDAEMAGVPGKKVEFVKAPVDKTRVEKAKPRSRKTRKRDRPTAAE